MEKDWFKTWFNSPYYHLLHAYQNEQKAQAFIDKLIEKLQPEANATMLDTACGRGQYAKYIADKGFDVTGVDLSPDAIEAAKETEQTNLHFFEQDLRLPYAVNLFDYCFNFFTSFGYFRTQWENENALRTIVQSLKPGGTFVIDYLNTAFIKTTPPPQHELTIGEVNFKIGYDQDEHFFYNKIEVKHSNSTTSFTGQFRKYSPDDFTAMLQKQGMQVKQVFGNYELADYDKDQSPRLIIIAERKN